MKESKKLGIYQNNEKNWSQFNWIKYEIELSLDAVKKMIDVQNNSFLELDEQLYRKVNGTRRSSGFKTEEELDLYVSHIHVLRKVLWLNWVKYKLQIILVRYSVFSKIS